MNDSAKWRLHLLGGFGLSRHGQTAGIPLGLKERALLAYLILHPNRRETRQKLATLLWGNISEESAHHSLNESLSKLRKAHEDQQERKIFANQGDYIVVDSASFEIDARDFVEFAKRTDRDSLEKAEALHAGELLGGLEVRTEGFEEWLRDERAQLEELAIGVVIRLMELREAAGETDRAIDAAHGLLRVDPSCEEAHRLLMRQHWKARRWRAAFEQYQACAAALKESHGIAPSPETRQLLEEIRHAFQQTGDRTAEPAAKVVPPIASSPQDGSRPSHGPDHGRYPGLRLSHWLIGVVVALTLVVMFGMTYTVWYFWPIPELAPAPLGRLILAIKGPIVRPPSIVVLPFKGSGDDVARADAYADAIAEGISSALAKASEMFVIAQSSASIYKGRTEPVLQIARELGVRYALEGSLQKWGDRVMIQVALIDTEKGEHRQLTESFEGTAEDFYNLQRTITLEVITSLQVKITEGEKERINLAHGTGDLDAWLAAAEAYKLLRHLTPDDNRRARRLYLRAIELDPNYAGAQEGLAWTHFIDARFGWSTSAEQSIAEAVRLADIVLSLDATRPRVYSLLGSIQLINRNYDAAVALGEKAVTMEPNDADAAFLLGYTLTFAGKPQQAIVLIERAIERTPYPPGLYRLVLGRANRLAGFHEDAVEILENLVAAEPGSYIPYVELAATYTELGATSKARSAVEKVNRLNPDFKIGDWVRLPAFRDDATTAHEIEILLSAGLPE